MSNPAGTGREQGGTRSVGAAILAVLALLLLIGPVLGFAAREWWQQQRSIRHGETVRRAINSLGGRAGTVRMTYAVGGGVFFVGHRPCLRGHVATNADRTVILHAIQEACQSDGIQVPKGCRDVGVGSESGRQP